MKHAGPATLAELAPLLDAVRARPELREKSAGSFYWKSRGFLHFHEDPAGTFADVRLTDDWVRFEVTTRAQQNALLKKIIQRLATPAKPPR